MRYMRGFALLVMLLSSGTLMAAKNSQTIYLVHACPSRKRSTAPRNMRSDVEHTASGSRVRLTIKTDDKKTCYGSSPYGRGKAKTEPVWSLRS